MHLVTIEIVYFHTNLCTLTYNINNCIYLLKIIIILITYCSWMNRIKKPSNKAKIFYFINGWLLPKLPPKVWLWKLGQLGMPSTWSQSGLKAFMLNLPWSRSFSLRIVHAWSIVSLKTISFYVFCCVSSQNAVSSAQCLLAFKNDLTTFIYAVLISFCLSPHWVLKYLISSVVS
jgi:hypothetical protein